MREVRVSDITMKEAANSKKLTLTFKEKLEMAKLLDTLGVSVIETEGITQEKIDSLRIKSIASAIKNSILAVPVRLDNESVQLTWTALKEARRARLQVVAAVSPAQIEYIHHKKAPTMLQSIIDTIKKCREYTADVEFVAEDATRSDRQYLYKVAAEAIEAGASTITVCDSAGAMLPHEFQSFVEELYANVPQLRDVTLGISCSDELSMADACAVAAVMAGAGEIKAAAYPVNVISLDKISKILASKEDLCSSHCSVRTTQLKRITSQIRWICESGRSKLSPFDNGVQEPDDSIILTAHDDMQSVMQCVEKLGYDLSEEDSVKVYESFLIIASKKEKVESRELDAIVASAALQVPPTYTLESYVINSGNIITATAHIQLKKDGQLLESVCIGDGPISAAFLSIEAIAGRHYELDDFQIQSVTQGHEAMGETVVKLRSEGKIYSGRGISTDIVGSSIRAYINALNKIVYEEQDS